MKYRPEIDGLRSIAVLPVIFFHAGFSIFSGGFIGVDIFFVISGYLITTIIWREITEERFSILGFYERRARRILPALMAVVISCLPFAYFWMLPIELMNFSQSIVSTSTFISNIFFWFEADYFDEASELKPLLHTWSLAVEEQFYIFFPFILLVSAKFLKKRIFLVTMFITLGSLIASELFVRENQSTTFYLLPFRFWELSAGAMIALWPLKRTELETRLSGALSALGLTLIACGIFLFDKHTLTPSLITAVPVFGTMLVIRYASQESFSGRLLSLRPLVFIGLLSYSMYLWHQPIFAFARLRLIDGIETHHYVTLITLTFVLSLISWRFVEQPFRNRKRIKVKHIWAFSSVSLTCMVICGVFGHVSKGLPTRLSPAALDYWTWRKDLNPVGIKCMSNSKRAIMPQESCLHGDSPATVALWGDSHAMAMSTELGLALSSVEMGVRDYSHLSCPPGVSVFVQGYKEECLQHNKRILSHVTQQRNIEVVVLTARWSLYLTGKKPINSAGFKESGPENPAVIFGQESIAKDERLRTQSVLADLDALIEVLIASDKKVILILPVPEPSWHVPKRLARLEMFRKGQPRELKVARAIHEDRVSLIRSHFNTNDNSDTFIVVNPADIFCDEKICHNIHDAKPLYADDDHLNSVGARLLSNYIMNETGDILGTKKN